MMRLAPPKEPIRNPCRRRRIARRNLHQRCNAVSFRHLRTIAQETLDLSPYGLLILSEERAEVGDELIVSFEGPGRSGWFTTEAVVARVVRGHRRGDPGYALGLRFTGLSLADRLALRELLEGIPPPVPARPLRSDYVRSVQRIGEGARPEPA
jgi:hypothetical protein